MSADDFMDGKRLKAQEPRACGCVHPIKHSEHCKFYGLITPDSSNMTLTKEDYPELHKVLKPSGAELRLNIPPNVRDQFEAMKCEHHAVWIATHPMRGVILTSILQKLLCDLEAIEVVELIVNETVMRSPFVDKRLTQLLDIKLEE